MNRLTSDEWRQLYRDGMECFGVYLPEADQEGRRVVAECVGEDWEAVRHWAEEQGVDPYEASKAFIAGMADAVANHYGVE